eukprot:14886223-Ditylum_brightwellii.AAC.1
MCVGLVVSGAFLLKIWIGEECTWNSTQYTIQYYNKKGVLEAKRALVNIDSLLSKVQALGKKERMGVDGLDVDDLEKILAEANAALVEVNKQGDDQDLKGASKALETDVDLIMAE